MAKTMGGDLVLQLLQEFREHQQDYKGFKGEMLSFKRDMLEFREIVGVRLDLMQEALTQTHGYLKLIVKMLHEMSDTRQRVNKHDEQLKDHEQRLTRLEKEP